MSRLYVVDAAQEVHFKAMSLIHAMGWRTTYVGHVPDDYMAQVITDDHWVAHFREDYERGRCHGLLLYRDETPVACLNYGPCRAQEGGYEGWGELISFYTNPSEQGKGYGGILMDEALRRLRGDGFSHCYVLVLRENEGARRFYAAHGFSWDGTHENIPFPHGRICVDLRYCRALTE